jgi:hypothetical protein
VVLTATTPGLLGVQHPAFAKRDAMLLWHP